MKYKIQIWQFGNEMQIPLSRGGHQAWCAEGHLQCRFGTR